MDISVLIATYKRHDILRESLKSYLLLKTNNFNWEIILVDNFGDAETHKLCETMKTNLPISYLVEKKQGKNNALNYGLDFAKGDLLVFADDDVIVDPSWLWEIWDASKRWSTYDIFGGKTLPKWPDNKEPSFFSTNKFFRSAYAINDFIPNEGPCDAGLIWGTNMAIRSKVFKTGWRYNEKVGPSGDNYITGSETEILLRLQKAGFKAVHLPKAIVLHQIRNEQLTKKWIYKRAFKVGRAIVYHDNYAQVRMILGVPRYMIKRLLLAFINQIKSFSKGRYTWLDFGIEFWKTKGAIYEYAQGKRNNTHV